MTIAHDLFGQPIFPPRGMGRPRHLPTAETRQRVRELRAAKATLPTIAAALAISIPTLLRNYPAELGSRSQLWKRRQIQTQNGGTTMHDQETLRRLETNAFFSVGAKAAASGAGRAARLASALALLPIEDRQLVLAALDETTRPMSARELEKALMQTDLNCTHRKAVVAALKPFAILMVAGS
jgi:hypothetical protein